MILSTMTDIDEMIRVCDELGGPESPRAVERFRSTTFRFRTEVDETLDPMSEAYVSRQIALYEEMSGRHLDQASGEMTPLKAEHYVAGPNPYNSPDVANMARHSRAIMNTLAAANLPAGARVLDMGCGWGLSSELIAFCGAEVDAVDINPEFVRLVNLRAEHHRTGVKARVGTFDDCALEGPYDLILFYECLHHAVRPWQTIERMASALAPTGKIAIAGEPINAIWWKHWGLRLDYLSVYCIRKFGWFESGWSESFIKRCFASAGLTLELHAGIGLSNGHIGYATRPDIPVAARPDPSSAGHVSMPVDHTLAEELRRKYDALYNSRTMRLARGLKGRLPGWMLPPRR